MPATWLVHFSISSLLFVRDISLLEDSFLILPIRKCFSIQFVVEGEFEKIIVIWKPYKQSGNANPLRSRLPQGDPRNLETGNSGAIFLQGELQNWQARFNRLGHFTVW